MALQELQQTTAAEKIAQSVTPIHQPVTWGWLHKSESVNKKSRVSFTFYCTKKYVYSLVRKKQKKQKNVYGELEWGGLLGNGVWFMAALIDRCLDTAAEVNKYL